jgi:hypothetical protein
MANKQNLKPLSTKKAREIGAKGGKASVEARRKKRDLREALEMLLEKDFKDKNGNVLSGTEVITAKLFEKASKGDVRAFETIRSTVGQDPVQKVMIAEVDQSVIDEVESAVLGDN